MVNNSENILVEFDYQNISVIDPNKVIAEDGTVKERLINQEDLVFYANLECSVTPRTKLALGVPQNNQIQTISVGKINFLNPGFKDFLDSNDTDEITGKNTIQGKGVNQPRLDRVPYGQKSEDYFINQTLNSNGLPGTVDNGLLGINQINISYGTEFLPEINITMEDVKGRALFEGGNDSPYAAFFNLPYPVFYLTIKGYLGKAIRIPLMLQTFNASFDPSTHNFRIQCKFYTYKYTVMADLTWGQIMAVPQMYRIKIDEAQTKNNSPVNNKTNTSVRYTSGGYQKMKELYSEYKAKGLIDETFPEITILELKKRLGQLITNIENIFRKKNLDVLNDLKLYSEKLGEFSKDIYLASSSNIWSRKWLDYENIFIQGNEEKTILYKFKTEFSDIQKQNEAITELEGIIKKYLTELKSNKAVGKDLGDVPVTVQTFFKKVTISDINIGETLYKRTGKQLETGTKEYNTSRQTLQQEILTSNKLTNYPGLVYFTGPNSFQDIIKKNDEKFITKKQEIEQNLTDQIIQQFKDKNNGLGFEPTIRNVLAIFFAQGEAFYRLMDDVHSLAWSQRENRDRIKAVFDSTSTVKSVDYKPNETKQIIYPWPQLIVENQIDGKEKYELKYPGDYIFANRINAFVPEIWPEVQFVEEFLRGYVERQSPAFDFGDGNNDENQPRRFSFNAIEFPIGNDVFSNKEEVKFFYEIYERLILNSYYSKFNRSSIPPNNIQTYVIESETDNLLEALGTDNPFLSKKLKEFNLDSQNYLSNLKTMSNSGEGQLWNNFIRGIINTPYIKNDTTVPYGLFKYELLQDNITVPKLGLEKTQPVESFFGGDIINEEFDFSDLYPLTDLTWCKNYLANGNSLQSKIDVFKTSDTLKYRTDNKVISNKDDISPISSFNYKTKTFDQVLNLQNLSTFYNTRSIEDQYTTEGSIYYTNYSGNVSNEQTTSIFNTPFFTNAIQKGVSNFRYNLAEKSPYRAAAYLFLNSLPLATLKEKYKKLNPDNSINNLSYILPSLKKFGAIHNLPYAWVLKYGSIWNRYKSYKSTGVDFLDEIWKNTDYIQNYDPGFSSTTTTYQVNVDGQNYDIVLDKDTNISLSTLNQINTGFYPKLINDFNFFFQGQNVFKQSSSIVGTYFVTGDKVQIVTTSSNQITPGTILSGSNLSINTTIVSQISGTTNGPGLYTTTPIQTSNNSQTFNFIVTNKQVGGITSSNIQNELNKNFKMVLSNQGLISKPFGFDLLNPLRNLTVYPWSCFVVTNDNQSVYAMPSFGSSINQANEECFNVIGNQTINLKNNPALHNGSGRLFWKAPQYGYFDVNLLSKPNPDEYTKQILNNTELQENFSLHGDSSKYSKIDELFTAFSPEVLDMFEIHFLNFSKSIYDFETILPSKTQDDKIVTRNENFQGLMREMFLVQKPINLSGTTLINKITEDQKNNIQKLIDEFMNYKVTLKIGNPSNFDKKLFYSFSTKDLTDKYSWTTYKQDTPNALPTSGGSITLLSSKTQYPQTWASLETYVGFSEIPQLKYTDNGSYITDFFVDMNMAFTVDNIKRFSPIIKLYAQSKLSDSSLNQTKFYSSMNTYIDSSDKYVNLLLNDILTKVRAKLGNVNVTNENTGVKYAEFEGEQTRLEIWETFKAMNDKWISGGDFKTKTLFEDVLLVDRASRDIGQKIYVDIFKMKDLIEYMDYGNTMLGIIETIFRDNRFTSFILPSYANFYNVQEVSKNPTPRPEGTLDFANNLFGTFLNVDYRETTAKYLAIYSYVPSTHLAMNENVDYRYRDDAFDLRRASDNPLLENQEGKNNWDKSNKVVGFNVDFGPQNQQIFKSLDIAQDPGKPTAESEQMLTQMANLYRNRSGASQSVSLYNVYKNRSYKCTIDMMGNALMQPTMYFNLRNVPMFSGPYMITHVSHRISENGFDTTIEGQRQPFYSIPAIDTLLQSLTTKILDSIKERLEEQDKEIEKQNNVLAQKSAVINRANSNTIQPTNNQNCSSNLNKTFETFTNTTPQQTTITFDKAFDEITKQVDKQNIGTANKAKMFDFIVSTLSIESANGTSFKGYDHNYGGITLDINPWGGSQTYMNKKYFCADYGQKKNVPYASFDSFEKFIEFFISKLSGKIIAVQFYKYDDGSYKEKLARANVLLWPTTLEDKIWNDLLDPDKKKIEEKLNIAMGYYVSKYKNN